MTWIHSVIVERQICIYTIILLIGCNHFECGNCGVTLLCIRYSTRSPDYDWGKNIAIFIYDDNYSTLSVLRSVYTSVHTQHTYFISLYEWRIKTISFIIKNEYWKTSQSYNMMIYILFVLHFAYKHACQNLFEIGKRFFSIFLQFLLLPLKKKSENIFFGESELLFRVLNTCFSFCSIYFQNCRKKRKNVMLFLLWFSHNFNIFDFIFFFGSVIWYKI